MFTPHANALQRSPHRRDAVFGTRKREGNSLKSHLGDAEAASVSPKRLFNDLKETSGKKTTTSKQPCTSRAFGDKTNLSPSRDAPNPSRVPFKKASSASPSKPSQSGTRLGNPSKSSTKQQNQPQGRNGVVFLGAGRSPSKNKDKAKSKETEDQGETERKQEPNKSSVSPRKMTSPMKEPSPADLSYRTQATPAQQNSNRVLRKPSSFVTPAENLGEAGAKKLRYGEMLDAFAGDTSVQADQGRETAMTEDELYPEVEYMPPNNLSKDFPPDFPFELDGLPRGKEMGEKLAAFRPFGFADRDKAVDLFDAVVEIEEKPPLTIEGEESGDELYYPDVVTEPPSIRQPSEGTVPKKAITKSSGAARRPTASSVPSRPAPKSTKATASHSKGPFRPATSTVPSRPVPKVSSTPKQSSATGSRPALKPKNQLHPQLRDIENDALGKAFDAKLKQSESTMTGFALDD